MILRTKHRLWVPRDHCTCWLCRRVVNYAVVCLKLFCIYTCRSSDFGPALVYSALNLHPNERGFKLSYLSECERGLNKVSTMIEDFLCCAVLLLLLPLFTFHFTIAVEHLSCWLAAEGEWKFAGTDVLVKGKSLCWEVMNHSTCSRFGHVINVLCFRGCKAFGTNGEILLINSTIEIHRSATTSWKQTLTYSGVCCEGAERENVGII